MFHLVHPHCSQTSHHMTPVLPCLWFYTSLHWSASVLFWEAPARLKASYYQRDAFGLFLLQLVTPGTGANQQVPPGTSESWRSHMFTCHNASIKDQYSTSVKQLFCIESTTLDGGYKGYINSPKGTQEQSDTSYTVVHFNNMTSFKSFPECRSVYTTNEKRSWLKCT